ncbi:cellulose-binding protein [Streptomyces sp. L2]|uniref:cellulose-binding protein n=1 Tax=Streptomyces sp. L2 TaxID=2162665 RepID=UPI0013E8FA6F|nr:cellulose-binding protein [Streptomyces sp. L2]
MSSASVPPHGFVTIRGRGYRPAQVDAYLEALSRDRDAAWERAARLTVLAREMEAEAVALREAVAQLAPQTYESLGESARRLYQLVLDEAADVRVRARRAAEKQVAQAEASAQAVRREAREAADALRAEADDRARQRLLAAQAEADDLRVGARREVKERRGEALAALREVRQRTTGMLAEQAREHAERLAEVEAGLDAQCVVASGADAGEGAAAQVSPDERVARAEATLAEVEREFTDAEEAARRCVEEAEVRAAEIVAEARVREERVARQTERVLRGHKETRNDLQAHMDHVRNSLITLTGRAPAE